MTRANTHNSFKLTRLSCFVGIFVQAIVCNLTAVLFIPMMDLYGFTYIHLGVLVSINFIAQVLVDIIFSGVIDKSGYRRIALPAIMCAFIGLVLFAAAPILFKQNIFIGIVIATVIFASSSGLLEVLVSPIVDALPSDDKGASMALMHSFYAWGQVAVIAITTLFVFFAGGRYWQIIVLLWSAVPIINFVMFWNSPFPKTVPQEHRIDFKKMILKPFYIIALFAIFFGAASELVMAQWSSTFMDRALSMPKVVGDLLGMCGFALMMGVGRLAYGIYGARININNALIAVGSLAAVCYITVAISPFNWLNILACALCGLGASLLWPGTLVVSAKRFPTAGAWMFAILAAAGDIGGAVGPYLTGLVADNAAASRISSWIAEVYNTTTELASIRLGILISAIFPIMAVVCHVALRRMHKKHQEQEL